MILDGVFNHISSDSPLFDRYHNFSSVGACESLTSQVPLVVPLPAAVRGLEPRAVRRRDVLPVVGGFDSLPQLTENDAREELRLRRRRANGSSSAQRAGGST